MDGQWKGDRREVEAGMEMSARRLADLEQRVLALEERARRAIWNEGAAHGMEDELAQRYGEYVDKTLAAQILGVTRATVYAMLADGRIAGGCSGRRVAVRSIARYMQTPRGLDSRRSAKKQKAAKTPPLNTKENMRKGDKNHECA